MADTALAVIEGIITRLTTDSTITALVGDKVYTDVTRQTKPPYIVLSIDSDDFSTKSSSDMSHTLRVQTFSSKKGLKECLTIRKAIVTSLDRQEANITIAGATYTKIQKGGLNTAFKEADGKTWQSVVQFDIVVQS